jgi:hypothetical protein
MKKTHVPNLSITNCQCHNRQLALHFCAILGVGMSLGSGIGISAGTSARSSVGTGNMVRFSL